MKHLTIVLAFFLGCLDLFSQSHLPPAPTWNGKSTELLAEPNSKWITPFEKSNGLRSASVAEWRYWFSQLKQEFSQVNELVIGQTVNETPIWAYAFSQDKEFAFSLQRSNKPLIIFQAGIHSGEIDGLDAGMMLYRDLCTGPLKSLASKVDVLFIPAINIDGLMRLSDKNRINQRGPLLQGWRSNSLNQNLNRDYSKLDSYEIKSVVELIVSLHPELYVDIHVTDGADYQYDITYGFQGDHAYSPNISRWLTSKFRENADQKLSKLGHIPGDLVFLKDEKDPLQGNQLYTFGARFSHGYGDARHLPTVLVENHSLKPFNQRVLGTRVLMEAMLEAVSQDLGSLRDAIKTDENSRLKQIPITWEMPNLAKDSAVFRAIQSTSKFSEAAGGNVTFWNAEKVDIKIPLLQQNQPKSFINRPNYFCIPANRTDIKDRIKSHGIKHRLLENDSLIEVELLQAKNFKLQGSTTNQGRTRMNAEFEPIVKKVRFLRGSMLVSTDQPLGTLACILLDPNSPDSFFQWGFFGDIAERTEYFEAYAMAPLADEMMKNNPTLKSEFEAKCASDEAFRNDQDARLRWWYERSEWSDENWMVYPIGKIKN